MLKHKLCVRSVNPSYQEEQAVGKASNNDRDNSGRFLAAFDRDGRFTHLYFPKDFSAADWPIAGALQLALTALVIAHTMIH